MSREELDDLLIRGQILRELERVYREMDEKDKEHILRVEVWNRSTLAIQPETDTFDSFKEWLGSEIETIKAELGITK